MRASKSKPNTFMFMRLDYWIVTLATILLIILFSQHGPELISEPLWIVGYSLAILSGLALGARKNTAVLQGGPIGFIADIVIICVLLPSTPIFRWIAPITYFATIGAIPFLIAILRNRNTKKPQGLGEG